MPPFDPNKMKKSQVDKYKNETISVAIKKLKVTKKIFIKEMWKMDRFGWPERGKGKIVRIARENLRFEVMVSKVDVKGIKIGNPVVIWIDDKLLFNEARTKLCECFGVDQDYTIAFNYDNKWARLETDMDYENCIRYFKHFADLNGNGEKKILRMEVRVQVKAKAKQGGRVMD